MSGQRAIMASCSSPSIIIATSADCEGSHITSIKLLCGPLNCNKASRRQEPGTNKWPLLSLGGTLSRRRRLGKQQRPLQRFDYHAISRLAYHHLHHHFVYDSTAITPWRRGLVYKTILTLCSPCTRHNDECSDATKGGHDAQARQ